MTTLRKFIEKAVAEGGLKSPFTSQEVKRAVAQAHLDINPQHITSTLNNYSDGPGDRKGAQVQRGATAWLVKNEQGFSLKVAGPKNHAKSSTSAVPAKRLVIKLSDEIPFEAQNEVERKEAARRIVDYLHNKPFRILIKGSGKGKPKWYPENGAAIGWQARLEAYSWKSTDWEKTRIKLDDFSGELAELEKNRQTFSKNELSESARKIHKKIKQWGIESGVGDIASENVDESGKGRSGEKILALLEGLWGKGITEVDSTLTKVYALSRPNEYVIYDSRVATAILRIAEYMYPVVIKDNKPADSVRDFQGAFKHLGTVGGRGGSRLLQRFRSQDWPNAYQNCIAQREANTLCSYIVEALNKTGMDERKNWTLREVEAVLFMEGY